MATTVTVPLTQSPAQILQGMLTTYQAAMTNNGYPNVSVDPGSDIYVRFSAISNQISLLYSNILVQYNAMQIATATGADLDALLNNYGLARKSASSSEGFITLVCSVPTTVVSGTTLTGSNALKYQIVLGGVYTNGSILEIISVDVGAQTNIPVGTILTWNNTPASAQPTVVAFSAITGGSDLENDDSARVRLQAHIQNPPAMGNWQQLVELASASDVLVQTAFVYPVANGPGTQHIALVGYQTTSYVGRDIPLTPNLVNDTSYILGQIPVPVVPGTVITTVTNVPFNVAFSLLLPYPIGSPNNGVGGGWTDFSPWPTPDGTFVTTANTVTNVVSSTNFTITAKSGSIAISAGITTINWIDKSDSSGNGWIITSAHVLAFTDNGSNTYTITIDTPFPTVAVGDYIFPASVNAQNYLNAILTQFAAMGPGQKTNQLAVLPSARRQPLPATLYPDTVGPQFLRALVNAGSEVDSATFYYQQYGNNEPALPVVVSNPPNIFIPGSIGLYPQ